MATLKTKTVRGIGWSATSQVARLLMQILISAILARLLTPNDFGLIAMIVVFSNFVAIFSNLGLSSAIVQRKELPEGALSSIFWIGLGVGALLTIALAASAPLIAAFYAEPRLTPLIVFISTTFFISSFGLVPNALLTKEMRFKAISLISIGTVAIAGPIAVLLAFAGYGVWSLAWNTVLLSASSVVLTWIYYRWIPHVSLEVHKVKGLLGFGMNLTGTSLVGYFQSNLDNLLIGKFLGPAALGFYNLAYNLLLFPLLNVSDVIGRVMFPALSAIQHDAQTVREAYVVANRYIAAVSFPMMTGMIILAPELIVVVFGPKWVAAIPLVQILAVTALEQSIGISVNWLFLSQGRTDTLFRLNIFTTVVVVISFVVGLRAGVEGVAVAYTIATYALAYPVFTIAFRLVDLKKRYFLARLVPIIVSTLAFGVVAFVLRAALETLGITSDLAIVVIVAAVSLVSYVAFVFVFDRELFTETTEMLRQLRTKQSEVDANNTE
ncbi:MAG: MOP flippase family protein [Halobacteriota archaeon]